MSFGPKHTVTQDNDAVTVSLKGALTSDEVEQLTEQAKLLLKEQPSTKKNLIIDAMQTVPAGDQRVLNALFKSFKTLEAVKIAVCSDNALIGMAVKMLINQLQAGGRIKMFNNEQAVREWFHNN